MKIVTARFCLFLLVSFCGAAATPNPALLILNKRDTTLAIVDPATLQTVGKVPSGPDPHEVVASADGKLAYISNYGGGGDSFHTISVVDLVAQKALTPIDLGALHGAHGLAFEGGKLYFTAEANRVIGRYDPATQKIDWIFGVGQNRTHMVLVRKGGEQIFTSNVNSGTISIIEKRVNANNFGPPPGPPGGGPRANGPGGPPPFPPSRTSWDEVSIQVGEGTEGFDVSPDGNEVWGADAHNGTLSIVDAASEKLKQTLDAHVDGANRLKFTLEGKYVFVSSLSTGDLAIFDAASRKEIKRLSLGHGAAGILMRPDGTTAYVACSADNKVDVIDLKTLTVSGDIRSGTEPDGLAWAVEK